jgi:hypothetical protein
MGTLRVDLISHDAFTRTGEPESSTSVPDGCIAACAHPSHRGQQKGDWIWCRRLPLASLFSGLSLSPRNFAVYLGVLVSLANIPMLPVVTAGLE